MTEYTTYGTRTHSASELAQVVTSSLGLAFVERDSDYRGVYYKADRPDGRVEIQPNLIPGDDGEDDLYASEHPTVGVLLLTKNSAPDPVLQARLESIDGLVLLDRKSW
ncbi:hypothetical protein QF035_003583 [Streptomyces umbrinus]|uniref:Uncharacterized protein n=1 Tax=Streptomyces umbrinus TaxID=67370 RepID=A0ABU0SR82_9ACTN|nr:hypothetical protein [Streptomyces umbrinus]MDQ1026001.1 hypothetical protein [Streptomyces umbrinus]